MAPASHSNGTTIGAALRWLREYYFGTPAEQGRRSVADLEDQGLMVTGTDLVDRVVEAIRTRRSVLLTGPRGSGKSYCARKGIVKAWQEKKLIGGYKFLQGNREIPRDLLSEDMLVLDKAGKPQLLRAMAIRGNEEAPASAPASAPGQARNKRSEEDADKRAALKAKHPEWPAIRANHEDIKLNYENAAALWRNEDWSVLWLDEITRFADGFLDSLLSLTEERVVVRRGEDFYVPLIVVATANPPGYDATAKKLSPPLQARISRAYRVSQPPLQVLVENIIGENYPAIVERYDAALRYPAGGSLMYLAAAVTLCLWGDPSAKAKGIYYLSKPTRELLGRLMDADPELASAMRELGRLLVFGPDSRAVVDWLACAVGVAATRGEVLDKEHLLATAVEVLGHKVRESFNEGAEPDLLIQRDDCIKRIAAAVLTNGKLHRLLTPDYAVASAGLVPDKSRASRFKFSPRRLEELRKAGGADSAGADAVLARLKPLVEAERPFENEASFRRALEGLLTREQLEKFQQAVVDDARTTVESDLRAKLQELPENRRAAWLAALAALRPNEPRSAFDHRWQPEAAALEALSGREEFLNETERKVVAGLFETWQPGNESAREMRRWRCSLDGQFRHLASRHGAAVLEFVEELRPLVEAHQACLKTEAHQSAWLAALSQVLQPEEVAPDRWRRLGWDLLDLHFAPGAADSALTVKQCMGLMLASFQAVAAQANAVGRARARRASCARSAAPTSTRRRRRSRGTPTSRPWPSGASGGASSRPRSTSSAASPTRAPTAPAGSLPGCAG